MLPNISRPASGSAASIHLGGVEHKGGQTGGSGGHGKQRCEERGTHGVAQPTVHAMHDRSAPAAVPQPSARLWLSPSSLTWHAC